MNTSIDDLRIKNIRPLISPAILLEEFSPSATAVKLIEKTRIEASKIVQGKDDRLLVVVGPCSIHDAKAALEYAQLLKPLMRALEKELCIVMRVYFEKPRTTVGWKGLINDPRLDGSFEINTGLRIARQLLVNLVELGIPAGTEFLDTTIPQYVSDLICWGAIGARTTESQIHRELASGLSMPIGFKNGTEGNVQIAIDAVHAANQPHHFLGVTKHGISAIVATTGNDACHIILRGANTKTNYDAESIGMAKDALAKAQLPTRIMVDCSHGNSNKDYTRQPIVAQALCEQISNGSETICGIMLESNLVAGKQSLQPGQALTYGQSITDACIAWQDTKPLLQQLAQAVQLRRQTKNK